VTTVAEGEAEASNKGTAGSDGDGAIPKAHLDAFKSYIVDKKVVIADGNKTIRATVARALVELGAKVTDITLASTRNDARQAIQSGAPDLVFADYHLENHCGLELIQDHRRARTDIEKTLFVLVTSNATESAVAEAAEGDVDAYLLKPFTLDTLKRYVVRAGLEKLKPSEYRGALAKGKELLGSGRYPEAIGVFREAKKMTDKPCMACYYEGQTFEKQEKLDSSKICYEEGLIFNELHYRCLVALFDLHVTRSELEVAYRIIRKLSEFFPISPQRLCKTIEIAVRTHNYEDVSKYYDIFVNLDERREDLKRYLCAALVVGAMHQLRKNKAELALDLLRKAAVTAADNPAILREIVMTLVGHEATDAAKQFLKRFPPETQQSVSYLTCEYAILDKSGTLEEVLSKGRGLVKGGIQDPLIYKILIRRTVQAGFRETAEGLVKEALVLWPAQKAEFESVLKSA
jgi:CheY-like chemotaxis protein